MAGRDDSGPVDPWDDGYDRGQVDDDGGWTEADERRYQARRREELKRVRRRRRQATAFTVLVLLVLGVGVGAAGVYQGWWEWPFGREEVAAAPTPTSTPCPTPEVTAAPPAAVTVQVLNGTGERGLAGKVGGELQARGYVLAGVGNTEAPVTEVARVIHGPEGLAAARSIAANVDAAVLVDDGRLGTAVDLALGAGYTNLRPLEAATPSLAPAPVESPEGCVPPTTPADPAQTPAPEAPAPAPTT